MSPQTPQKIAMLALLLLLSTAVRSAAAAEINPHWLAEYALYHRETRGTAQARYLVYNCDSTCSGLSDRLRGVVIAFYAAIIMRRVVLVQMTTPKDLATYVQPNIIDWTWPQTLNKTCETTHYQEVPTWIAHIKTGEDLWPLVRVVCFRSNSLPGITQILNKTTFIPEHDNWTIGSFYGTAFRALFRPTAAVWTRINQITSENRLPPIDQASFLHRSPTFWIAAHVRNRRNGAEVDKNFGRPTTAHVYNNASVESLIQCLLKIATPRPIIYLASDAATAKIVIAARITSATYSDVPILHYDGKGLPGDHTWTWAEFLVLGHASCIVSSERTGFSMSASFLVETFADSRPRCYISDVPTSARCATGLKMIENELKARLQ